MSLCCFVWENKCKERMIDVGEFNLGIDLWGKNTMIQIGDKGRELKRELTLIIK